MAYNGSVEDPQNWPFSVRYTASPYRKSKFPVHASIPTLVPGENNPGLTHHQRTNGHQQPQQSLWTNNTSLSSGTSPYYTNGNSRNFPHAYHHQYQNGLPGSTNGDGSSGGIKSTNGNLGLGNYSQHLYYQPSYQQQPLPHYLPPVSNNLKPEGQYGLPVPGFQQQQQQRRISNQNTQYFTRNHQPRTRTRYPPNHVQQFKQRQIVKNNEQDGGVVDDEGYIEDLKQGPSFPNCIGSSLGLPPSGVNNNTNNGPNTNIRLTDSEPYSYVYDSTLLVENPTNSRFCSPSILERLQQEAFGKRGDKSWINSQSIGTTMPVKNVSPALNGRSGENSYPIDHNRVSSGQYNNYNASENEYEEIRDVAQYMSMSIVDSPNEELSRRPFHFKSFSSTDDILAEVVQVQQGHDRVLDQLNLEVENLLIRSTNEIENHSYSNISPVTRHESGTHSSEGELFTHHGHFVTHHQQSLSMDSCMKPGVPRTVTPDGHNYSNMTGSLRELKGGCGESNCSLKGDPYLKINHKKSKSETCAHCYTSGEDAVTSSFGISTFGRKKKLDRNIPFCEATGNSLKLKGKGSSNHHLFLPTSLTTEKSEESGTVSNNKAPKANHHRSYSLIPYWKIRDHLMRLPFLRQHGGGGDKLKKTESCSLSGSDTGGIIGTNTISASASHYGGFNLPTSVSSYSLKKKKGVLKDSGTLNKITMAAVKTRSSSMDELRVTGPEEHWYSADSDTEPDSFTALPSELSKVGNTMTSEGLLTHGLNNGSVNNPQVPPSSNSENSSSRLDVSNSISQDHIPKAPKFRRGSGIKDKWRESWTQSKTLSKSNMEEENRLLRWFSLRKNHGGSTTNVDSSNSTGNTNQNSTLPLLSEEDLKRISFMEDEEGYWPRRTVLPPMLPIPPPDLSPEQITRRHIVAAIVHSENNYVAALQRLVNEYKKPLECSHPAMLSHSKISTVFHRVPEILQCHSLFRIALAEYIRKWDTDEKIGDVFVASFSKSLVLDVYSEFINNFGQAMETAKSEARRKSAFAEFLKVKQMTAHDRLSLFGLMVKPVQRFPQFILLLQDLLKHTPKEHHDRMSLQLALTQLESLAAMLNERKRESEQYQAFRETIKSIGGGKFVLLRSITDDPNRILLRQDIVTQLEFDSNGGQVAKSKSRKLLLLNDMLICVTMSQNGNSTSSSERGGRRNSSYVKTSDVNSNATNVNSNQNQTVMSGKVEKSVFKWSYPVREVEVEDISISPTMSRFVSTGNVSGGGRQKGTDPNIPPNEETQQSMSLLEEMQSLMYDYSVLSRISELVTTLKSSYEGLSESLIKELMLEIQHQIRCRDEQISYFDSSCLTLLLGTGNNREKIVFQMQSPAARNEWIEELRLAQLALDPNNSPGWDVPPESPYPHHRLPLFVRSLPLCRSPHLNTVKAGCFFTHTFVSPTGRSKILDYLWVSCTDGFSSRITAFRSQQNILKEVSSFDLVEEKINDLIFVSGHVWMATESRKVMVFDSSDTEKGNISQCLLSDSVLKLTLFGNTIYAGLADGTLAVFTQIHNPKILEPEKLIKLGADRIISIFGARDHIYASCGSSVVTIDTKTHTIERNVVLTHHNGPITHMACSGVGLWITTQDSGTVCLYHLESLQHLQDVSIAPSVFRTVRDSYRRQKGCHVTCLIAHKGWLWIGTNLGVVLTIPLPRLEGVPIISTGKANVSYHGYYGPITFLMPLTKPSVLPPSAATLSLPSSTTNRSTNMNTTKETPIKFSENVSILKTPNNNNSINPPFSEDDDKFKTPPRNNSSNVSFDEKDTTLTLGNVTSESTSPSLSNSSSFNDSKPGSSTSSPLQSIASGLGIRTSGNELLPAFGLNKTLVVLRKKNSREAILARNCKTLPRGGPLPLNLRFSIDSDVYGLYGNLINVRGLEDEGRFVDPLYDALRRSDPELVALDAKINTLDRKIKMRMSRPRSLDLSNWSVDSKISASSDESVGLGGSRSSQTTDSNVPIPLGRLTSVDGTPVSMPSPETAPTTTPISTNPCPSTQASSGTTKKTITRTKARTKVNTERTVIVVVGGRGYVNMKSQNHQDHFINGSEAESKQCTHLTVWQMKT